MMTPPARLSGCMFEGIVSMPSRMQRLLCVEPVYSLINSDTANDPADAAIHYRKK